MRTKILCSIGPASESPEIIEKMIIEGMDIARFNFSHDKPSVHKERIALVRQISEKLGKKVQIFCDLQGPKIRVRDFDNPPKTIADGEKVVLSTSPKDQENLDIIIIEDPYLHLDLNEKDVILIEDGLIELIVDKLEDQRIHCTVVRGGEVYPRKGVNVPLTETTTNSLTEKDLSDLETIIPLSPDWIALSFVQNKQDIQRLRSIVKEKNGSDGIRIMAKIERGTALENINEIINETDGITVARGDLGVEIPFERVPIIQKEIIKRCNFAGKPVITATHMLASMTHSSVPTRAEISDIANAVFDGSDAVWLSNETTIGKYPLESVKTLVRATRAAEEYRYNRKNRLEENNDTV